MGASAKTSEVMLGFVDDAARAELLTSHLFPSKVGGQPAWLSLEHLPGADTLRCPHCGTVRVFLLQIYNEGTVERAFHRTIFLFACLTPSCYLLPDSRAVLALRSQLPRINPFFSSKSPDYNDISNNQLKPETEQAFLAKLCAVCGCFANKKCAKCKLYTYCCTDHQIDHWKNGHRVECNPQLAQRQPFTSSLLFPLMDIVSELEPGPTEEEMRPEERSESDRMREFEQFMMENADKDFARDYVTESLSSAHLTPTSAMGSRSSKKKQQDEGEQEEAAESGAAEDKQFDRFRRRVTREPEQVLRYERHGRPLLVSRLTPAAPACSCGAPRSFELQVLPQLLTYFNLDRLDSSVDWASLYVYTCSVDCDIATRYAPEFAHVAQFESNLPKLGPLDTDEAADAPSQDM